MANTKNKTFWDKLSGIKTRLFPGSKPVTLSREEKGRLKDILADRRLELEADKQLRSLEESYNKPTRSLKDSFSGLKEYRMNNLAKRQERVAEVESKKQAWQELQAKRKAGLITSADIVRQKRQERRMGY